MGKIRHILNELNAVKVKQWNKAGYHSWNSRLPALFLVFRQHYVAITSVLLYYTSRQNTNKKKPLQYFLCFVFHSDTKIKVSKVL